MLLSALPGSPIRHAMPKPRTISTTPKLIILTPSSVTHFKITGEVDCPRISKGSLFAARASSEVLDIPISALRAEASSKTLKVR